MSPEVEAECQMFNENGIKPSLQVDLLKFFSSNHPTFLGLSYHPHPEALEYQKDAAPVVPGHCGEV